MNHTTDYNHWTSDSWIRTGANNCSGITRFNGTKPSHFSEAIVEHYNIDRHTIKYQLELLNSIKRRIVTQIYTQWTDKVDLWYNVNIYPIRIRDA